MIVHKIEVITFASAPKKAAREGAPIKPPSAIENASIMTKAGRLKKEVGAWLRSGAKIAPKEIRIERLSVCAGSDGKPKCPYYFPDGNLGLGECKAPGCGCTRVKVWLMSSTCPIKQWTR